MADIIVTAREIDEFDLAIATACALKSPEKIISYRVLPRVPDNLPTMPGYFYRKDLCLVLSFDGSWHPFLDNTVGYNKGTQRWYVPKASALIAQCAQAMQTPEQKRTFGSRPGGRLFFHLGGVLRSGDIPLLTWAASKASKYLLPRI